MSGQISINTGCPTTELLLYALNKLDNDQLTAEFRNVGGHQTHAVVIAGCGEMTHRAPLVLCRVVQEHLVSVGAIVASVATCSASRSRL